MRWCPRCRKPTLTNVEVSEDREKKEKHIQHSCATCGITISVKVLRGKKAGFP